MVSKLAPLPSIRCRKAISINDDPLDRASNLIWYGLYGFTCIASYDCIYGILKHTNLRGKVILLLQLFPQTVTEQDGFLDGFIFSCCHGTEIKILLQLAKAKMLHRPVLYKLFYFIDIF